MAQTSSGGSVAPQDPVAAARGISRRTQSEIYRAGISGTRPRVPVDADALEAAARRALSAEAFAYIAGGAGAERTVAANRTAFGRWQVWPRPLRDVSARDLSIDFLGTRRSTPLLLAPLGVMELARAGADVAVARAAASLGVPYTLSNQASTPMEEVARDAAGAARLFQLYWSGSDELNASLLRRAEASGCEAIVVTLDTHLLGWRTRDLDLAYLPFTRGLGIAQYTSDPVFQQLVRERVRASTSSATGTGRSATGSEHSATGSEHSATGTGRSATGSERPASDATRAAAPPVKLTAKTVMAGVQIARKGAAVTGSRSVRDNLRSPLPRAAVETFLDVFSTPALTWNDIAKARQWTSLPILLKGIVHPDDAIRALDAGMDGIWISNHGGRQIDQSVPTLDVLPMIADRIAGRVPIVFDSGVRQGSDVFIALALGATAVALGRPYAYGLGIAGEEGVREVVRNVLAELDVTLGLSGHTSFADVGLEALRQV
jgi:lactate 2-monooxygenase